MSAQPARGAQPPPVISPEVMPDRHITFRLLTTNAPRVRLLAGDLPGLGAGKDLVKGTNGVWEVTVGPFDPGAYRYTFEVDGVAVVDPRNPATSESNNNVWSLVAVPGSEFMDVKDVPHGAVAAVTYYSTALKKFRRMHVYTPPGYEKGQGKLPVFYLLHGAGDSDDSWTSIGRAGFILDNLLASKQAKPMIIVMPAGHTRAFGFGRRGGAGDASSAPRPLLDEFGQDFVNDILPYVESHYRVRADRAHRAIAGLSMGGGQTLNVAFADLNRFGYVGVFSSGLFGGLGRGGAASTNAPAGPTWEEQHQAMLDNPKLKKDLKLLWFSTGTDDFLMDRTRSTVAMLKKHGFEPVFRESTGGHTWLNWRNYLIEFTPSLFQK
jgi:enterochelin esterase-like enzyme